MFKKINSAVFVLLFFVSCYPVKFNKPLVQPTTAAPMTTTENKTPEAPLPKNDIFFTNLFKKYPALFDSILLQAKERNIQIIYTQVDRGANNFPKFKDYYFNLDASRYFYPASTVKMPVAFLALQKLNELRSTGINMNTAMITEAGYSGQTAVYNDPNTIDGKPSIQQYIKRAFLVSDNDAYNRLYEFLGQGYINDDLHRKGYDDVQILHRLDIFLSEDENRHTNPIRFLGENNKVLYQQPIVFNQTKYAARNDSLGKAYYKNDSLINAPMNFSKKNRISLIDLHSILQSVIFPEAVPAKQRFNLSPDDYNFLYKQMSALPRESIYPAYDTAHYPDNSVNFFLNDDGNKVLSKIIRSFNKVGEAYGQLIDVAYIVDLDKKIEFFLTASINCVVDGTINNDKYDYDSAGYPFLKNLGKVIYDFEAGRKRSRTPDLSKFKISYDK